MSLRFIGLRILPWGLAALCSAISLPALADAIQVRMETKVPAGGQPKLVITVHQELDRVEVALSREDGKATTRDLGALHPDDVREVMLDSQPGKHHYSGRITCVFEGTPQDNPVAFDTVVGSSLSVQPDKGSADAVAGRINVLISSPEGTVEVKVYGPSGGEPLLEHELSFADRDPAIPFAVTWPALPKGTEIARVDIKVTDASGSFSSFSLFPWSVYIPHEEVNFTTDSASIAPAEAPKLQASLTKITEALARHQDLGPITLYIAGHTDTVGTATYNLNLSRKRAQAIAGWFRKNGLRIPIAFEGFGEHALLVSTPDNTAEARNRRVDYILSVEDPQLKATEFRPVWKPVK